MDLMKHYLAQYKGVCNIALPFHAVRIGCVGRVVWSVACTKRRWMRAYKVRNWSRKRFHISRWIATLCIKRVIFYFTMNLFRATMYDAMMDLARVLEQSLTGWSTLIRGQCVAKYACKFTKMQRGLSHAQYSLWAKQLVCVSIKAHLFI